MRGAKALVGNLAENVLEHRPERGLVEHPVKGGTLPGLGVGVEAGVLDERSQSLRGDVPGQRLGHVGLGPCRDSQYQGQHTSHDRPSGRPAHRCDSAHDWDLWSWKHDMSSHLSCANIAGSHRDFQGINLCLKVGIGLGSSNAGWTNRHAELTLGGSSSFETG